MEKIIDEYDSSFKQGEVAQQLFKMVAQRNGWELAISNGIDALQEQEIIRISKDEKSYSIGVKSIKRQTRSKELQDKWIWVEERNIVGRDGWLYNPTDLIAFQTFTHFWIVPCVKLLRLAHQLVDFSIPPVTDPMRAQYRPYTRANRKDLIAQIQIKDLSSILWAKWKIKLGFLDKIKAKFIHFFQKDNFKGDMDG